jgi:hypothetical protein
VRAVALVGAAAVIATAAALTSALPSTASTPRQQPRPQLLLDLDKGKHGAGVPLRSLRNDGRAPTQVAVVRRDGGQAVRARARYHRWAARLPTTATGSTPPRAAIRVVNSANRDPFSPRARRFAFGADFRLDPVSSGVKDNGDNLVQRGHHGSSAQYKLQLDGARVMCRVKGADGTVTVRSRAVHRQRWYRARCSRSGDLVELRVWRLANGGPDLVETSRHRGRTGPVGFARGLPLSIGGKLSSTGRIPAAGNDQFNGLVDRVVYRRGR